MGLSAVGIYYMSRMITDIPQTLVTSLNVILLPKVSNLRRCGKNEEVDLIFKKTFKYMMLGSVVVAYGFGTKNGEIDYELFIARDYNLFAALADVRNCDEIPYICDVYKTLGFPHDVDSKIIDNYEEYWEDNGHSIGYVTIKDINEYLEKNRSSRTYTEYDEGKDATQYFANESLKELIITLIDVVERNDYEYLNSENTRLVFWFDN